MSSLSQFSPDDLYCALCHARAAGRCATCQALVCADCAEITGGAVKKVAVCRDCSEEGRGEVTLRDWLGLLAPVGLALLGLGALAVSIVALLGR